jgi:EAL domain-containing protein (putative c-di-GMP-specific phosphodiesterase class I)
VTATASSMCLPSSSMPSPLLECGTLYLNPPPGSTQESLRDFLCSVGTTPAEPAPGVLSIPISAVRLRELGEDLSRILTPKELRETRTLIVAEGVTPSLTNLMNMRTLSALVAAVQGEWLVEVLRRNLLETHFQPIVHAARPKEVFGYECLVRGRDAENRLITPDRLFGAARSMGLLAYLDRQARRTANRSAIRHGVKAQIFMNFNPSCIDNPTTCLRSTVRDIEEVGGNPAQFVFEVVESEKIGDTDRLLDILESFREKGFKVALDDMGSGYSSLNLMTLLKPDYIKLDMHLVRNVDRDPYKGQVAGKLLEMAQALGIRTVVEGIETEGEWVWAMDHGADYVQGFFFARPACPPPDLAFPARAVLRRRQKTAGDGAAPLAASHEIPCPSLPRSGGCLE